MQTVTSPLAQFFDLDGSPLEDGYVYIGTAGFNPETSPVQVYWDVAATQPAPQPLRTSLGVVTRTGSPSMFAVADQAYSMTVRNKRGELVFSSTLVVGQFYASPFMLTLLDDDDAIEARATLGVPAAFNGAHTGLTTFQNVAVGTSFTSAGFTAFDIDAVGAFNTNGWNVTTQSASAGGVVAFHNSATASNGFSLYRSRGTSALATDSQAGDVLGVFRASGWNLGTWRTAGVVRVDQEAYSAGVGYTTGTIRFFNVDYSGAESENLRIWGAGYLTTGGANAALGYAGRGSVTLPAEAVVSAKNTAKAWVNFNGIGTVAIRDSFNVSSITDNAQGDYTINYTNAISTANSAVASNCTGDAGACFVHLITNTAASVRIICMDRNTAFNARDQSIVTVTVLGV